VLTETTADLAFALMMAAARRLPEGDRYVRAGKWKTWGPMLLLGPDVHGATVGIVGFGRIGQAVARRAAGFGMKILYHDVHQADPAVEAEHSATFLPLEKLLAQADFVSLHVNLTPETRGLINAEKLGWMKPTAVLVNTSRGPVVDGAALATALRDGQIFAAGLDVIRSCRSTTAWSSRTSPRRPTPHAARWPRWPPPTSLPASAAIACRRRSTPRSTTGPDTDGRNRSSAGVGCP
jgi:glyoxylate reductase